MLKTVFACSLKTPLTTATDHLWLSPMNRLLADYPLCDEYVYDGAGFSIVLPTDLDISSELPLLVMGSGITLRFKNVAIYNAQSLSACLSMRPGAKLLVQASDDVQLFSYAPTQLQDPLAALERVTENQSYGVFTTPAQKMPQQAAHLQVCFPLHLFSSPVSIAAVLCTIYHDSVFTLCCLAEHSMA